MERLLESMCTGKTFILISAYFNFDVGLINFVFRTIMYYSCRFQRCMTRELTKELNLALAVVRKKIAHGDATLKQIWMGPEPQKDVLHKV